MSDPLPGSGADAAAQVDKWVAQTKAKAERYQAMQAAVGQVSVTESSRDGLVTVTVDSAGNLTELRITDQVQKLSGGQVSAAVLSTVRRAQARLPERLREVMTETIGDDQQTMNTIVGNYQAKFPEPEPEEPPQLVQDNVRRIGVQEEPPEEPPPPPASQEPPPSPPRPKRPRPGDGDDDDFGQSFMVRE